MNLNAPSSKLDWLSCVSLCISMSATVRTPFRSVRHIVMVWKFFGGGTSAAAEDSYHHVWKAFLVNLALYPSSHFFWENAVDVWVCVCVCRNNREKRARSRTEKKTTKKKNRIHSFSSPLISTRMSDAYMSGGGGGLWSSVQITCSVRTRRMKPPLWLAVCMYFERTRCQ